MYRENISGLDQTAQPRNRIIAFVLFFSLLKKLERIDNSVTDRYSLLADLCGYAERFVFDLLRKAFLLFGFSIYIFLQMPQRQRFACTFCDKSYCQKGKLNFHVKKPQNTLHDT